jgi:broad specificity phosphatase PhoE
MTTVLLVRHAEHVLQGHVLVGRSDNAPISQKGEEQIRHLADILASEPIAAVHSSPRARARQTAAWIAMRHGLNVETHAALDEIDFGGWTGLTFEELSAMPQWRAWNEKRDETIPPEGESMRDMQARVLDHLHAVRKSYPWKTVVLVSHAEPIRAALLHAMNLPLNEFARIDVLPGSINRLMLIERAFSSRDLLKVLSG